PAFQTRLEIERKVARGGFNSEQIDEIWDSLFLTKAELVEFLQFVKAKAHQPFLYPVGAFSGQTGARPSGLVRPLIDDVELAEKTALIREKKRLRGKRSTRRVPLSLQLVVTLKEWLAVHPGGQFLFCHSREVFRSKKRSHTTGHQNGQARPSSFNARMATV